MLKKAAAFFITAIKSEKDMLFIVDCDVDGYMSSAQMINYLYDLFPAYVTNHVKWVHHQGKTHGLSDVIGYADDFDYVVCIDSSSNDYEYHKKLKDAGISILVIDHHEAPKISEYAAAVVNNQLSDYPNKAFCGAGVGWQVCRYLDKLLGKDYANDYLDMVAVANQSDMMDGRNPETKAVIFEGLKPENIHNPFIAGMINKNEFSFNKSDYKPSAKSGLQVSPMGVSFFLTPMVNAICRSGTLEEKEIIFLSMLKFRAYDYIPSTKRGHKLGDTEQIITQALRVATNVKNRQERTVVAAMEHLEELVEKNNMLKHKVLLFLMEPGEIAPGIAGLVANKLMAKYQRCTAVLTKTEKISEDSKLEFKNGTLLTFIGEVIPVYVGSMRAYSQSGLDNFKDICEQSKGCYFVAGHQSAAGLGIYASQIEDFLADTDKALANLPETASYHVDYVWDEDNINGERIIDLANLNEYIMTNMPRSLVCIKEIIVDGDNLSVMGKKADTIKITAKCGIPLIKFGVSEDEMRELAAGKVIRAVCKPNANEWNGSITPQLMIEDYEILRDVEKTVTESWGF